MRLQFVAVLVAESRNCGQHTTKDPRSGLVGIILEVSCSREGAHLCKTPQVPGQTLLLLLSGFN